MGFEAAAKSGGETKLADYYLAALEFIDPQLEPRCSLYEVLEATEGRRMRLMQAPLIEVREELAALDEALHFIQRVHGGAAAVGDGAQAIASRLSTIAVVEAPLAAVDTVDEPVPTPEPPAEATAEDEPEPEPEANGEPVPEPAESTAAAQAATFRQATLDFDAQAPVTVVRTAEPQLEPKPGVEVPRIAAVETGRQEDSAGLTPKPVIGTLEPVGDAGAIAIDVVVVEHAPAPPPLEPVAADEFAADTTLVAAQAAEPIAVEQTAEPSVEHALPETAESDPPSLPEFVDTEEWVPPAPPVTVAGEPTPPGSEPPTAALIPAPADNAAPVGAAEEPPIRIELRDLLLPEPVPVEPEKSGRIRRKRTGPSLREVMIQAQLEAMADHVPKPQPAPDVVAQAADRIRSLPAAPEEASTVRIIKGLALICWQAWLALFAGWTVVRLFAWPLPAWGEPINLWQAGGVLALGGLAAAIVARSIWLYRIKTRRLLMLAHLTGAVICLDLLAWRLAMLNTDGFVAGPPSLAWVAALAGWPLIACLAWLSDLRANRPARRRG